MSRYVVLDFETYPVQGKSFIMEIGCVEVVNGEIGETYHTLVRPVTEVSEFVLNLTGISEDELSNAPPFCDIMDEFYNFINDAIIVAHNSNLDCMSYEVFCRHLGIDVVSFVWLDSQDIIKLFDPTAQTLQLQNLLDFYGFRLPVSHRAKEDAVGLANLLIYYSNQCALKLTAVEFDFFSLAASDSRRWLRDFITANFKIEIVDPVSFNDWPLQNSLNSDTPTMGETSIAFFDSKSSTDILTNLTKDSASYLVVTAKRTYHSVPYIFAPSAYVFPDKISRLYPLLSDARLSHIEMVEFFGIINWLRHTSTYILTDLNDQLIQRYNHSVKALLETHPLAIVNYVWSILNNTYVSEHIVECDYEMLVLISMHAPRALNNVSVVIYNFIHFNRQLSKINEKTISFGTFKKATKLIFSVAYIIDYLTFLGHDNLKFVQDFARLKNLIHLVNEERTRLFQKIDFVVEALSINIYDFEKRQILVNENVVQTVEWQEVITSLSALIDYFDEILKFFKKISYYIHSDVTDWFGDLIYLFKLVKQSFAAMSQLPTNGIMYIESDIKHKPSNCQLVIKNIYENEFYDLVNRGCFRMLIYQPLFHVMDYQLIKQYVGSAISYTGSQKINKLNANIVFETQSSMRDLVGKIFESNSVCIVVASQKRVRFWRQKLRSFVLSSRVNSTTKLIFKTYSDLSKKDAVVEKYIFPEFFIPNTFQPIHQIRLEHGDWDEIDYMKHIFYEEVHVVLDYIANVSQRDMVLNVDRRLSSLLSGI
jgi:DNA polymerase III epsilon subunit family exonuclease